MKTKASNSKLARKRRKRCYACGQIKLFRKFYKYSNGRHSHRCRPCEVKRVMLFNKAGQGKIQHLAAKAKYILRRKFGLTPEQSEERKASGCEICLKPDYHLPGGSKLGHDHDHLTGKLRGVLCTYDNFLVGHLENGREFKTWDMRKQKALEYIERHKN
jgi:hypothetical protein